MYESDDKMVSHPDHYKSESGLEVIDVIEAFAQFPTRWIRRIMTSEKKDICLS